MVHCKHKQACGADNITKKIVRVLEMVTKTYEAQIMESEVKPLNVFVLLVDFSQNTPVLLQLYGCLIVSDAKKLVCRMSS